ncbi:MAG: hypothetical protein DMD91_30400 [Candidatus Rokuibacteriota bacterium]|nr:MAG: hypothetical protein DMD91_30400 [Candidatus Rokubacteria bacterium]
MIGAVAPEILRLHRIVTGASKEPLPTFDSPYFLISIPNSFIGGAVAMAFGAATAANCFMVGAFWPLMMTSFARQFRR